MGIALVGCGRISASHLAAIAALPALCRLVAVVDPDAARAAAVAGQYGVRAFTDLAAVLELPEVEAVCICTPNELHTAQTLQALAAGRHVLLEKPMAETYADAQIMADAADRTDRILALGHTFRHSAPIRYLQDHRAAYGRLRAVEISQCFFWDGPQAPWWASRTPAQGLILSLLAPHALDFAQLAMGDEDPSSIHALATRHQAEWAAEDEAMILLGYPSGCMTSLHLSYNQPNIVDRKMLCFEHATVVIEGSDTLIIEGQKILGPPPGNAERDRMGRDLSEFFETQLAAFVDAVRGRPHRSVLHREALRLTALVQSVLASALANSAFGSAR